MVTDGTKVPPKSKVMGIPGKIKREITQKDIEKMKGVNKRYRNLTTRYKASFYEINT